MMLKLSFAVAIPIITSILSLLSTPTNSFIPQNNNRQLSFITHPTFQKQNKKQPLYTTTPENANPQEPPSGIQKTTTETLPFSSLYATHGLIGNSTFVISRTGPPTPPELANSNLLQIVRLNCTDLEVNTVVWKCLGYRFDPEKKKWTNDECFPNWKAKYPNPPDLINMQRIYSKEIDEPSLRSNQALVRSIPMEYKQSLKKYLKPLGFPGYKLAGLTPNKTRRAQCTNWLLFYRENLFGKSVEQLREERRVKKEKERLEEERRKAEGKDEEWKPPVTEVF